MKKIFLLFILTHYFTYCFAQKSMIEVMKAGQTLTMKVASNGDAYTDPAEYYIIQIVKIDSLYAFSYTYRGNQTKKKINQDELNSVINFEKTAPNKHVGLAYDEVTIVCGRKAKRFLTWPDADVTFLKKFGIF